MKYTLIYFSPTNETKKLNDYFLQNLENTSVYNITDYNQRINFDFSNHIEFLILSFPIYSQDIPRVVKRFIKLLRGKYVVINTTYGGISSGNGFHKAYNILSKNGFKIIGGSILSTHHSYIDEKLNIKEDIYNIETIKAIIDKIKANDLQEIKNVTQNKNILAKLFPDFRSRMIIKKPIVDLSKCNKCYLCINNCPVNAIDNNLKINHKCIRCTRCIIICPQKARDLKRRMILNLYLKRYGYKHVKNIIITK